MKLDIEVLTLAEDVLREKAGAEYNKAGRTDYWRVLITAANAVEVVTDTLDPDND